MTIFPALLALLFQVFAELIKSLQFLALFSSSGFGYASYRHYRRQTYLHRVPFSSTAFEPKDMLFDLLIGLVTWLRHIIFTNVGSELFQSWGEREWLLRKINSVPGSSVIQWQAAWLGVFCQHIHRLQFSSIFVHFVVLCGHFFVCCEIIERDKINECQTGINPRQTSRLYHFDRLLLLDACDNCWYLILDRKFQWSREAGICVDGGICTSV